MGWALPTAYYVVGVGALGITSKLALRTLPWQDLLLWSGLGYVVVAGALVLSGKASLVLTVDGGWAAASAALAITSLVALYVALNTGKASVVVPITAAYPAVTLILAAAFLGESLTLAKAGGAALVIGGVVLLTVSG